MLNIDVEYKKDRTLIHGLSFNFACDLIESVTIPTEFKIVFMNGAVYYNDRKTGQTVARFSEIWDNCVIRKKYIDKDKWNNYIKVKW